MKLWKLIEVNCSAVVAAESAEAAAVIHPFGLTFGTLNYSVGESQWQDTGWIENGRVDTWNKWPFPDQFTVTLLGEAVDGTPAGMICYDWERE